MNFYLVNQNSRLFIIEAECVCSIFQEGKYVDTSTTHLEINSSVKFFSKQLSKFEIAEIVGIGQFEEMQALCDELTNTTRPIDILEKSANVMNFRNPNEN